MNARQKNLVTLLAAAVVAGGLGLYAYFGVMKPQSERPPAPETPGALFPTSSPGEPGTDAGTPAAPVFTSISIERPQGKVELELRDGTWRITSPMSALAERKRVLGLIDQLADAKFTGTVTDKPTDEELERFGLKPPQATVSARAYVPDEQGGGAQDPSRQRSVTFHLGIENIFDGSVYVRREGDPHVYLASGALRVMLLNDISAWRSHEVFTVDESSLLRIELKGRKDTVVLERATTDKPWQMARPMVMRADSKRVARIFSDLKLHKALGFPEPEWEPQVVRALEKPAVEATLVPKIGGPLRIQLVELEVGGYKRTFARTEGGAEPMLAEVDSNTLNVLTPPPLDFKSKKVLEMRAGDVQKLVIHPGGRGEPITLEQNPETNRWEVVSPLAGRAREFKVASLLGSLEKLEAEAVAATGAKLGARHGITDGSRGVTLMDGAGHEIARLWIGNPVPGNDLRTFGRGSSEDIYELKTAALEALPLSLEELLGQGQGSAP
ncbi:DUF4340 domain-containing protein [Cystobacter ferrugineus]|uniref:DUF4340 domain-containing protein n=1 Tax=Cystobacter ferrugineus TaxID=83449 RepID=A0A1L9B7S2_9BACT|nr:DUF4340 domain-containing protein [Cystobacter ferrugineus]OJH38288.1 hypothetical protein BON30_24430 [Cystobacter ferrugineus]